MTDDKAEFEKYQKYFDTEMLLSECRDKTELAMRELGEPEFEIYRPQLVDAYFPYTTRTEKQRANYYIALFAVAQNEHNFHSVPLELKTPEFMKAAFKLNPKLVKFLPRAFTEDPEVLRVLAKYRPELLKYIGMIAKEKIALMAVSINPSVYLILSEELQKNPEIIYVAINRQEQSNINEKHYDDNLEHINKKLNIEASKEVGHSKEQTRRRYKGPILRSDRKSKDDK